MKPLQRLYFFIVAALIAPAILCAATFSITGGTLRLPSGCVTNDSVATSGVIDADKLQHVHLASSSFALAIGATPASREEIVYVAAGAETIRGFSALLNDTGTSTDCDFVLKKNGTTLMASDLTVTHSETDREVVPGSLSSTTLAAGDVLSIQLVVNSSTGAQGPYAWVAIDANAP